MVKKIQPRIKVEPQGRQPFGVTVLNFCDRLDGKAVVMIIQRPLLTNRNKCLHTHTIPQIVMLKACTHSSDN